MYKATKLVAETANSNRRINNEMKNAFYFSIPVVKSNERFLTMKIYNRAPLHHVLKMIIIHRKKLVLTKREDELFISIGRQI